MLEPRIAPARRSTNSEVYYGSAWKAARKAFLAEHPLCAMCEREGRFTAAAIVDHIEPHRGDLELFWRASNWQPLCKPHHDREKQREERAEQREANRWR
jgi:5-methylcytosine-specific restriction protein A